MPEKAIELDGEAGAPAAGPGKLLTMLVAANLLITVGLVAMLVLKVGPFNLMPAEESTEMAEEMEEELPPPIYESMDKPVVVNFRSGSKERYLQLVAQFLTRSEDTVLEIRNHMPAIVDGIYRQLGQTQFAELQTLDGREALRMAVLKLTQEILEKHTGEPGVEEVFFTTFVFQ